MGSCIPLQISCFKPDINSCKLSQWKVAISLSGYSCLLFPTEPEGTPLKRFLHLTAPRATSPAKP